MSTPIPAALITGAVTQTNTQLRSLKSFSDLIKAKSSELDGIISALTTKIADISKQVPTQNNQILLNTLTNGLSQSVAAYKNLKATFENLNDFTETLVEQ